MTNRDLLDRSNNAQFARFLVRYTNCLVCVVRDRCPHHPDNLRNVKDKGQNDGLVCADRIERWLGEEYTGGKKT